jgi:hypothetical protein
LPVDPLRPLRRVGEGIDAIDLPALGDAAAAGEVPPGVGIVETMELECRDEAEAATAASRPIAALTTTRAAWRQGCKGW